MKAPGAALAVVLSILATAAGCAPQQQPRVRRVVVRRVVVHKPRPAPVHRTYPDSAYSAYVPWGQHTIDSRLAQIGPASRRRWQRYFYEAAVAYPATSVELVAFKREKRIDVFAGPSRYELSYVRSIAMTAASGGPGPKLREGDRQVPEGVYEVESLNPNSDYHVALKLAYPNAFDRRMAAGDRRGDLGGGIMIHGSDRSIGCIAVGDQASEDLFVLAADAGLSNVTVMIVPRDFRRTGETWLLPGQPMWVHELYADLELKLRSLPQPPPLTVKDPPSLEGGLTSR